MQWIIARDGIRIVFLNTAVGQMYEQIVYTVGVVGILPSTQSDKAFLVNERLQWTERRDQDVNAQIKLPTRC